jgi:hypothetical protein
MAEPPSSEPRGQERPAHLRAIPSAADVDATDWPAQVADTIERVVQGVRDKTTGPAINAARWLVAGMFALFAGTAVLILVVVMLIRALDSYLPGEVWAAHLVLGLVLAVVGVFMIRHARRTPQHLDTA